MSKIRFDHPNLGVASIRERIPASGGSPMQEDLDQAIANVRRATRLTQVATAIVLVDIALALVVLVLIIARAA